MSGGVELHPLDWAVIAAYFGLVVGAGLWFSRFTKTTQDFFFGGQRFAWWLVAISCVATLVGSYSFINYSEVGFNFGLPSLTNYTNEWFVLPFFLIGWLPIIYFSGVVSIPEYFERRFDRRTRILVPHPPHGLPRGLHRYQPAHDRRGHAGPLRLGTSSSRRP